MKAVDLFAGAGGFTLGASMAGAEVVWAANHWPLAVEVHERNHPSTTHVCQDLRQADFSALPEFDLLLVSPACQGHSQAAQPKRTGHVRRTHDALRATAWAVIDCADVCRPAAVVVENVVDFQRWLLYPTWIQALETLGYHVQVYTVTATDHGVPQLRRRLFVVATQRPALLSLPRAVAEPSFRPCLEESAANWRPIASCRGQGARSRLTAATQRTDDVVLVQHVTGHRGISVDGPIRTITTKDQWCLARGDQYRPLTRREYARGMGFPDAFTWPDELSRADVVKLLGNAVPPPVAQGVVSAVMEAQ